MPRLAAIVLLAGLAAPLAPALAQPGTRGAPAAREAAAPAGDPGPDLPIRRITLYRSGVGFFQRQGEVEGDRQAHLSFHAEQVNDILKSLVILDLGGGRIDSVSYASKDPVSRRLGSFQVPIADNPPLGVLLERLRGSTVELLAVTGPVVATIVGTETRKVPSGKDQPLVDTVYVNFVPEASPGTIETMPITELRGVRLRDRLKDDLDKALGALDEQRAETVKTVDITFSGAGEREVVVAYVHEMPVWKTSYRLILPEAPAAARERAPDAGADREAPPRGDSQGTLQGWAIVENTTDQDWNDVRLSLVAGRPVSFQMDLYEPLYVERAQVPVPVVAGVAPRQYQGTNMALGLRDMVAKSVSDQRQPGRGRPAAAPAPAGTAVPAEAGSERDFSIADYPASARQEMARELSAADLDAYAPEAAAAAGMVGEVFQYDLSSPVTIERQRSALIPIITASVPTRRVSIFNLADGSQHPMRGVEIINPAEAGRGLQLLPGPISVFDGAAYAGDAQIGHIPPGDNRLLAYAVDLDVVALTRPEHTSSVTRLRIVGGLVEQIVKQRNRVVYGFENKDAAAPRTVLIEHPRLQHGEWELAEPKTAAQTTPSYYRFELELAPKGSGTLTVAQETTERHTVAVTSFDLETVLALHRDGKLSDRVLETFREISRRQGELADLERTLGEVDRQVAAISADQQRIRSNMGAIERNSELYVQYMRKLTEQEGRLEQLGAQRAETLQRLEAGRAALDEYLRTLDVE